MPTSFPFVNLLHRPYFPRVEKDITTSVVIQTGHQASPHAPAFPIRHPLHLCTVPRHSSVQRDSAFALPHCCRLHSGPALTRATEGHLSWSPCVGLIPFVNFSPLRRIFLKRTRLNLLFPFKLKLSSSFSSGVNGVHGDLVFPGSTSGSKETRGIGPRQTPPRPE